MLKVENLHVYYGVIHAIKGVSFSVEEGQIVTLIGSNGAGKSTILKTISQILKQTEGTVTFLGNNIDTYEPHNLVHLGISHVPEGRHVFPGLTVLENLEMGAYSRKDKKEIKEDFVNVFTRFPRLEERKNQLAGTLSGGEQQMLTVGRSLMGNPDVLLLDESLSGVDVRHTSDLIDLFTQLCARGTSVLVSTHDLGLVRTHFSRCLTLNGHIIGDGSPAIELSGDKLEAVFSRTSVQGRS